MSLASEAASDPPASVPVYPRPLIEALNEVESAGESEVVGCVRMASIRE